MPISVSQYIQGNVSDGVVLPRVAGVTAGFGILIDANGVISVDPSVLPVSSLVKLGALQPTDGSEITFSLVEYGTTNLYTLSSPDNLAVFLGGVIQLPGTGPGDSYVVTASQVIFNEPPPAGSTFFAITVA
jgi:hypothetical protein